MSKSIAIREGILVLVLMGVCYAANWTGDYYSYIVATRWHSFRYANGTPRVLSGGSLNDSFALLAVSNLKLNSETVKKASPDSSSNGSSISTIFRDPINDGVTLSNDDDVNRSARAAQSQTIGSSIRGTQNPLGGIPRISGATAEGGLGSSYGMAADQIDPR